MTADEQLRILSSAVRRIEHELSALKSRVEDLIKRHPASSTNVEDFSRTRQQKWKIQN